jgi:hypothetical protein
LTSVLSLAKVVSVARQRKRSAAQSRHLALGDASFLNEIEHTVPTFGVCAEHWLTTYANVQCKRSTKTRRSYEQLLRPPVMPRFGSELLSDNRRDEVKQFVAELSQQPAK